MTDTEYDEDDDEMSAQCQECGWELRNCLCVQFAEPGGRSALRRATRDNPRCLPCPCCGRSDRLTPADVAQGYQCDSCADEAERGGY